MHSMNMPDSGKLQPNCTSDEIKVILFGLKSAIHDVNSDALSYIFQKELDWDMIYRLAEKHRMIPLLYSSLKKVPPDLVPEYILTKMSAIYMLSMKRAMIQIRELIQVMILFKDHEIPLMPYKGMALSQQLYGDIGLRISSDIDIIVHQQDAIRAKALLVSQGYAPGISLTPEQDEKFVNLRCEYDLFFPGRSTIDIHWQFIPYYYLAPFKDADMWSELKEVALEGREILTLSPEMLLIALCIHGAKHQWKDLKQVCDIAAIIALENDLDWEYIVRIANEKRMKRILFLGLRLVEVLMETRLPPEISVAIQQDPRIQHLVSASLDAINQENQPHDGEVHEVLYWVSVRECVWDKIRVILLLMFKPNHDDWRYISLPAILSSFYYIIRPIRLVVKYGVKG